MGNLSAYTGTVIDPGTANSGCEYPETYKITEVYVTKKFNKSKKVKVATRFMKNSNCDNNDWGKSWHANDEKIIEGKNILNIVHNTSFNLRTCTTGVACEVIYDDVFGVVFERDWYACCKVSGTITTTNCPDPRYIEFKIKSKKDNTTDEAKEIYAIYTIFGLCLDEIREYKVPLTEDGDHNAYIRIKATTL